jgi:transaldolase
MPSTYELYVDSADEEAVGGLLESGLVVGVTTNPTILVRAGKTSRDIPRLHAAWQGAGARSIFFQAWGPDATELLKSAHSLRELGDDVTVKVPATRDGFVVARRLIGEGTPVLVTAVYSAAQALVAGSIGASYIAPYLGRLDDAGRKGLEEIAAMHELVESTQTVVLAASLRTPDAIVQLAERGIRAFTAAPAVIWAALTDPVSDSSAEVFENDARA